MPQAPLCDACRTARCAVTLSTVGARSGEPAMARDLPPRTAFPCQTAVPQASLNC